MKALTSFAEVHARLAPYARKTPSAKEAYDLHNITKLLGFLGDPQNTFRAIHVAGTSGKTSTSYYIAAALKQAGKKVGLTVSPHIDEVNERVQIDLVPLAEHDFGRELQVFLELVRQSKVETTYFELLVAFAFWEFAKQKVDYAVVEVGLGGLLDGTNTITRPDKICVITDIGLDHMHILGKTIPEITAQKAGIIHAGNEVFMYEQSSEVMEVVEKVCSERQARLHPVPRTAAVTDDRLPVFQRRNLGLALQAANFALARGKEPALNLEQIGEVIRTYVPGRMERRSLAGKTLVIDGAHNAQKMAALVESVTAAYPGQSVVALVAFVDGPDARWQGGLRALLPIVNKLIITSFKTQQDTSKHSVDPYKLQKFCKNQVNVQTLVFPKPADAFEELRDSSEGVLLVTGSFYLLNGIHRLIMDLDD